MIITNVDEDKATMQCTNCQNLWNADSGNWEDEIGINDNIICPKCHRSQNYVTEAIYLEVREIRKVNSICPACGAKLLRRVDGVDMCPDCEF